MNMQQTLDSYKVILNQAVESDCLNLVMRQLCLTDLFFLLTQVFKRKDVCRPWLFDRCREVQANPNGYIDLWSREHYKSTIITYGLTIQDILNSPEITVGIFSFSAGIASGFLGQIKTELESNQILKRLFSDIFYDHPQTQSPKWNLSEIVVKRKTNPKEATVSAYGIIESLPTSKHFKLMIFDDIITERHVTTPDQVKKAIDQWMLALSLGSENGRERYAGTRYAWNDVYDVILESDVAIPRIYPATDDGTREGSPVLFTQEYLDKKIKQHIMKPYIFDCQFLLNPSQDSMKSFKEEWLQYWDPRDLYKFNIYIIVDPANSKNKRSDYTAMVVVGVGSDNNYYIIDMVRDRLNLKEKVDMIMNLHRKYGPIAVYYEAYGIQADIFSIEERMKKESYNFTLEAIGGKINQEDRIVKLGPLFADHRIFLPNRLMRTNCDNIEEDLTKVFIDDEYLKFPWAPHVDVLDALSRITDEKVHIVSPMRRKNKLIQSYGPKKGIY